jgi:hypothetical protein
VRLGFDPRQDKYSLRLQVVDLRHREEEGGQLQQLCDLQDERVERLLAEQQTTAAQCTVRTRQKKYGWLTPKAFAELRRIVKSRPN